MQIHSAAQLAEAGLHLTLLQIHSAALLAEAGCHLTLLHIHSAALLAEAGLHWEQRTNLKRMSELDLSLRSHFEL